MQSAREKLKSHLEEVKFKSPLFPVISNVSGKPVNKPASILKNLLKQITNPVRWKESMIWCRNQKISRFYEIGPGRVLRGLLRRIDRDADCDAIGNNADIQDFFQEKNKS
jgi:[acyl-carrier-protein] S-malonyltransferase